MTRNGAAGCRWRSRPAWAVRGIGIWAGCPANDGAAPRGPRRRLLKPQLVAQLLDFRSAGLADLCLTLEVGFGNHTMAGLVSCQERVAHPERLRQTDG